MGCILISYITITIIYLTFLLITFFTPTSVLPFLSGIINLGISSFHFQFKLFMRNLIYPLISIHLHSYWLAVWVTTGIPILLTEESYIYFSVSDPWTLVPFLCSSVTISKHLPV